MPNEKVMRHSGRSGTLADQIIIVTAVIYVRRRRRPIFGLTAPLRRRRKPRSRSGARSRLPRPQRQHRGRRSAAISAQPRPAPLGSGGAPFQDPGPIPDLTRITKIAIRHGALVDSIATTYLMPDGSSQTFSHGGAGGSEDIIHFVPGERIIAVVGRSGDLLDNIAFLTEDPQGTRRPTGNMAAPGKPGHRQAR